MQYLRRGILSGPKFGTIWVYTSDKLVRYGSGHKWYAFALNAVPSRCPGVLHGGAAAPSDTPRREKNVQRAANAETRKGAAKIRAKLGATIAAKMGAKMARKLVRKSLW